MPTVIFFNGTSKDLTDKEYDILIEKSCSNLKAIRLNNFEIVFSEIKEILAEKKPVSNHAKEQMRTGFIKARQEMGLKWDDAEEQLNRFI